MTGTRLSQPVAAARQLQEDTSRPKASVFTRIVCGVDETAQSLEAVRQAARFCVPGGMLHLIAAVNLAVAVRAGWASTRVASQLLSEAENALRRALLELDPLSAQPVSARLIRGRPVSCLLAEIRRESATVLALGSPVHSRRAGLAFGDVGTTLLHEAPCSVLIARPSSKPGRFPRLLVVGIDGSAQAAAAVAVASTLCERFGAELQVVTALGGKPVDPETVVASFPEIKVDRRRPVDVLVAASGNADLVVVGSRGLHGLRGLGSVSERIAHQARSSVLVVRGTLA